MKEIFHRNEPHRKGVIRMTVAKIFKRALALTLAAALCMGVSCETKPKTDPWVSAVFGGGPFVTGGEEVAEVVKSSGFNTMIIWSVHVNDNGDLVLNDVPVASYGRCIAKKSVKDTWANLKSEGSGIQRVEISIGAWGCADFENIKKLIEKDGTGEDTILYKNFKALIEATGADAVNFDDESCYDVESAVKFGQMCAEMGVKVALCPYTQMDFWKQVKTELGDTVDRVYVQCYDGGAGNDPDDWAQAMGMDVIPGYWCLHGGSGDSAADVSSKLKESDSITGGFMWLYDDMQKLSSPDSPADYAAAINNAKPAE